MPGSLARGYFFLFLFMELLLVMHILFLLGLKSVAIGMRHIRRERRDQTAVKTLWWAGSGVVVVMSGYSCSACWPWLLLVLILCLVLFFFKCEGKIVAMVKHTIRRRFQQNAKVVKSPLTCRLAMGVWGVM
jgi:hypothetical protein